MSALLTKLFQLAGFDENLAEAVRLWEQSWADASDVFPADEEVAA